MRKMFKFHLYKIQLVHPLKENDYPVRVAFFWEGKLFENFKTPNDILFSNETHFHLDGFRDDDD